MNYTTDLANNVSTISITTLANAVTAWVSNPEARTFYENIRDNVAERIDFNDGEWISDDDATEIADDAPDVYNETRMLELIGTGAYLDDLSEFDGMGDGSIITLARYALYDLAVRVIDANKNEVGA